MCIHMRAYLPNVNSMLGTLQRDAQGVQYPVPDPVYLACSWGYWNPYDYCHSKHLKTIYKWIEANRVPIFWTQEAAKYSSKEARK